ncbi:MAG: tetratricopeptide repeat protein [Actinobacteria bacterium]|nr:tetratricopeptide repeat protein [Acidobacteriota bacterium]MCA1702532.1 tetratricopeptide repeat protein [Actinomycetota bacterium]
MCPALSEHSHQLYQDMLGQDHPDTLRSATNLADGLRAVGDYEQARALDEQSLTHYRRVLERTIPTPCVPPATLPTT